MDLSIVIVNYNVEHFLAQCLVSVRKATAVFEAAGFEAEVWVVDNRSVDGSCELVRRDFPEVKLLALEENVGFSRGNNEAVRQSTGEWVLLLNPDTVIPEDALVKTLIYAQAQPKLAGLGVPMVDGQGRYLPESKRGLPSPWAAFCKISGLYRLAKKSARLNRYYQGHLPQNATAQIEILSGAFMWMRRKALDEVGLLDEQYFMYGEDIDLSWRLLKGGWENHYYAGTSIIHYKGESTKKGSLNYVLVFYKAMLIFAKTHFEGSEGKALLALIQLAIYFRAALAIMSRLVKKWALPAIEWTLIFAGLVGIMEVYSEQMGILYPWKRATAALAMYAATWTASVWLNGGYDQPWRTPGILKGVAFGTLVLLAIYGLLPESLRFSRAILLAGSGLALLVFTLVRKLFAGAHWENQQSHRRLFVSGPEDLVHLIDLVDSVETRGTADSAMWALLPEEMEQPTDFNPKGLNNIRWIGSAKDLAEAVRVHRITEVVLSGQDLTAWNIIDSMSRVADNRVQFRIAWSESGQNKGHIMGSGGPEMAPITELHRAIQRPAAKRNKKLLDLLFSSMVLSAFPIWLFTNRLSWLEGAFQVLLGRATWVGFSSDIKGLPALKPHLLNRSESMDPRIRQRINLTYARDYRWTTDLGVIQEALISRRAIHRHGNN
jgi:O-antigen biosynthesis protein